MKNQNVSLLCTFQKWFRWWFASNSFCSIIILRFDKKKVANEEFYCTKKKQSIKIWDVDVDERVILN